MANWRVETLAYPVPQVLEAAVDAASSLGFGINQVDRAGGRVYLTQPWRLGRRDWPLDLSFTDSGLGTTVLRASWESARQSAWPLAPRGRCAGRLCSRIRGILAGEALR